MKTTDFASKISSKTIKENMNKMFGLNVNLEKYSREQLEDMRNKLRTRVFQQEGKAGINDLLTNETYQKDKAMLALLNTRIKEMLGEDIKKLRDKMDQLSEAKKGVRAPKHKIHAQGTAAKDYDGDGKKESPKDEVWGSRKKAAAKAGKPFEESAKPDFLDMDKDGNKKEPMKKAVKDKKVKEASHQEKTTMKHVKNPTAGEKKAAKDIKPGIAGYADRVAMLKSAEKDGRLKNEGFPTVDDAKKAAAGTASMKAGEKKKSSTGGTIEKTATGLKHTAGKNYGGQDAPKTPDSDKKAKKTKESVSKLAEANSVYRTHVRMVNESLAALLAEDEEGKAKAITAAGDMVNDFTSWMQRVGQYQTKTMIELADAIKADFGAQEAEAFKQAVAPALSSTLEVLTQQREAISGAVAVLAGEATPDAGMGMEPGMGGDMGAPEMEPAAPDEMNTGAGDEFGASDAAAGVGTPGREMRESKFARKLAESHSILAKLAK